MPKRLRLTCLLSLVLATSGCEGREASFVQPFAGDPYLGDVTVRILSPDGGSLEQSGRASARIEDRGDSARLTVFGAIENEAGDAGFTLEGQQDARGWRSESGAVSLRIDPEGRITGGGTLAPQAFSFDGRVSPSALHLVTRIELLARSQGDLPAGTVFEFVYDLSRAATAGPATADGEASREQAGDDNGQCSEIRYEMRPVASLGEGTMSMMQVPVCVD